MRWRGTPRKAETLLDRFHGEVVLEEVVLVAVDEGGDLFGGEDGDVHCDPGPPGPREKTMRRVEVLRWWCGGGDAGAGPGENLGMHADDSAGSEIISRGKTLRRDNSPRLSEPTHLIPRSLTEPQLPFSIKVQQ